MNTVKKGIRKRSNALMIMVSDAEKKKIRQAADRQGMTMSSFARIVLLQATQIKKQEEE